MKTVRLLRFNNFALAISLLLVVGFVSPALGAKPLACGPALTQAGIASASNSSGELDQVKELKTQIEMNAELRAKLNRIDEAEHSNRTRFMKQIRQNGTIVDYKGEKRPLRLLRIGFRNISYLNGELLTLTHTERFLEKFYLEFYERFKADPDSGGIVLHRYIENYVITPMTDVEIQTLAHQVNLEVKAYLEQSRSEEDIRIKKQIGDFTWESMMDQVVTYDTQNIDLAALGLSSAQVKAMTLEQLFSFIIRDAHVQATFRTARLRFPHLRVKHYQSFDEWALDAKNRANFLKATIEDTGVNWNAALKHLHELAGDPTKTLRFQQWLSKAMKGSKHFNTVHQQFMMYIFDWQMANFFQYYYNPKKIKLRVKQPNPDWSPLEMLPMNRLERRREFFEQMKQMGSFVAIDFRGLGFFKRVEQDRWIQAGAKFEDINHIFDRLNLKLRVYFNRLYNEIDAKTGPKKLNPLYDSGDDGALGLPPMSEKMLKEIEELIASRPLVISDIIPGVPDLQIYSSGAYQIKTIGDPQSMAEAIAHAREDLFDKKKKIKEEEERQRLASGQ